MEEEIQECNKCETMMEEIGDVQGSKIELYDHKQQLYGVRCQKLYQCPECKKVELY